MRAVICSELGPPSLLTIEERPDLMARSGQVVVAVEAAGVNFVDGLFIAGRYQIKPALPFTPGGEIAGRIAALGEGVAGLEVGQRVLANIGLGGYASQVAIPALAAVPLPAEDVLSSAQAATFVQSFCTCLYALRDRAHVEPGQSVLVLGAGGGIGLAAIAVARALGCRVIGAASSEEKRAAALAAGAEAVIDSAPDSLKDKVRAWSGGTGVDVVIDPIGGPAAEPSLRALGDGGRYAVIGFASGTIASLPMNQVLLRNRTVLGIDWGVWSMQHGPEQMALLTDLLAMVAEGRITPIEPASYALEDVSRALEDLLARRIVGKVALIP
ncbi:MAG TPA: NADPH:quinone oxidoreductase family protein [Acidimicrobiales bacterium]|jgi:NADPH2:quinone reductase|nr:NADPH:quinone oxidoreductase family protein [Acidimicrobiales bacterium]